MASRVGREDLTMPRWSPRNAMLGFIIIGLPSLWYTLPGRFSLVAPQPEPLIDDSNIEIDDEAA